MRFTGIMTVAVAAVPLIAVLSHAAAVASDAAANDNVNGNWAMMARIADECARDKDTAACVAVKASVALERAARSAGDVQLLPGLTVAKNERGPAAASRDSRALPTEEELRGQLQYNNDIPEGNADDDRADRVTEMVIKSAVRFLQSRTLKFDFPQTDADELARSIEEGRAKLKKKVLPILGLLAVKIVAVLPILLGIIGFFALKALVFGKLALLIAGVLAFQKYAGAAGGFGKIAAADPWATANSANAWSAPAAPGANGGYYRRSMETAAQQMAYNGQMQPSAQTVA